MKDKQSTIYDYNNLVDGTSNYSDFKEGAKLILSKNDAELYDETKATPAPVIRIRRTNTASKGERWKVMRDEELLFIIEGNKISKREREYLRTVSGVSFVTSQVKTNNISTVSKLRISLKEELNTVSTHTKK